MRTALCPGSFDPPTNGHMDIFETASRLYDRVVVAPIRNLGKDPTFTIEERLSMLKEALDHLDNVEVVTMAKLTVDVARDVGAEVIVKGLRFTSDFENELQQAQTNKAMSGVDTVFLPATSHSSFLASSLVREIAKVGGVRRVRDMVPEAVYRRMTEKFSTEKSPR